MCSSPVLNFSDTFSGIFIDIFVLHVITRSRITRSSTYIYLPKSNNTVLSIFKMKNIIFFSLGTLYLATTRILTQARLNYTLGSPYMQIVNLSMHDQCILSKYTYFVQNTDIRIHTHKREIHMQTHVQTHRATTDT